MFRPTPPVRRFIRPFAVALFATLVFFPVAAQTSVKTVPPKSTTNAEANAKNSVKNIDTPSAADALLPKTFAGWELTGPPELSANASAADDANAPALREYGFARYEVANYTRADNKIAVKAIQFGDATGAFGAFTFYRRPNMIPETIGQGAAFDGARVLFWQGTVLVDAKFTRLTPMSVAELRDFSTQLPKPTGNQGTLPTLPSYLPPQHLESKTLQYAVGPQAYRQSGGVLPSSLIDFDRSAEVVTAQYNALNGTGTLTIINYPTPEIAIDRERAIQAYFAAVRGGTSASSGTNAQGPNRWTPALADGNPSAIQSRRSGPLVAVTSGSFSAEDAQQLLQRVHYEVNLTMSNGSGYRSDSSMVAQIVLDVAFMIGIFALIAIVSAISLGGFRIAWRKMRGKSALPPEQSAEFIRLNLKD